MKPCARATHQGWQQGWFWDERHALRRKLHGAGADDEWLGGTECDARRVAFSFKFNSKRAPPVIDTSTVAHHHVNPRAPPPAFRPNRPAANRTRWNCFQASMWGASFTDSPMGQYGQSVRDGGRSQLTEPSQAARPRHESSPRVDSAREVRHYRSQTPGVDAEPLRGSARGSTRGSRRG